MFLQECCSVFQYIAVCCSVTISTSFGCFGDCCSVLQCVVVSQYQLDSGVAASAFLLASPASCPSTNTRTHTHAHTHVHTHTRTHIHKHTNTHTHTHTRTHAQSHKHTHTNTYKQVHLQEQRQCRQRKGLNCFESFGKFPPLPYPLSHHSFGGRNLCALHAPHCHCCRSGKAFRDSKQLFECSGKTELSLTAEREHGTKQNGNDSAQRVCGREQVLRGESASSWC